jgi:hypothetical protein
LSSGSWVRCTSGDDSYCDNAGDSLFWTALCTFTTDTWLTNSGSEKRLTSSGSPVTAVA